MAIFSSLVPEHEVFVSEQCFVHVTWIPLFLVRFLEQHLHTREYKRITMRKRQHHTRNVDATAYYHATFKQDSRNQKVFL